MGSFTVLRTIEFIKWFDGQRQKDKSIIEDRISRIEEDSYFGDYKYLGDDLFELRWKNGRRIYFTKFPDQLIYILLGGLKNGQKKDIKKAKYIYRRLSTP